VTRDQLMDAYKEALRTYEDAYREWSPKAFNNYAEYERDQNGIYRLQKEADKAKRTLLKFDKTEAAKGEPIFVTWKRYGFRHIVAHEAEPIPSEYHGHPYTIIRGVAFCGNDYWFMPPEEADSEIWWLQNAIDPRSTDRPLCGTCRNHWKRLTGTVLV